MNSKIWLSPPHLNGDEINYIQKAFDSNWIAPIGENIDEFEDNIKQILEKDKEVACLTSGTAALHLALVMAGVSYGDEVICQSFTFAASANTIIYQGATPIFIDSESETWNLSPTYLEVAIKDRIAKGKKPKAIVFVHLYGMPAKVEEITTIAKKYDITLIEDAAESIGSNYKGQKCGTFGDYAIFSFNGNKIITTSGGGALICKDKVTKEKAVFLATQAKDNAIYYQHSSIGYNYRMSNILAGIGRGQIKVLEKRIESRRSNNLFYQELFKNISGVMVFKEPNTNYFSNFWLTTILIDENKATCKSDELYRKLSEANIESKPLWKPMHLQPVFEAYPYYGENISENLFKTGLCLPSGSNLSEGDKKRIATVILEFFS